MIYYFYVEEIFDKDTDAGVDNTWGLPVDIYCPVRVRDGDNAVAELYLKSEGYTIPYLPHKEKQAEFKWTNLRPGQQIVKRAVFEHGELTEYARDKEKRDEAGVVA